MNQAVTSETLDLIKTSYATPSDDIVKSWTQPGSAITGINAYDLAAPAKILYPVTTPLRNMIPRDASGKGTATNWRTITGINTSNISGGVGEGQRGGIISTTVNSKTAAFSGIGLEDYVTYEADYSAKGFDDVKALATSGLLRAVMLQEERLIIGGNQSLALGTTPSPTCADVTTGGFLSANTAYRTICVALVNDGYQSATFPTVPSPLTTTPFAGGGSILGQVVRTNADGTTTTYGGGSAQQSATVAVTTANDSNNTHQISAYVTPVRGAIAYAWYLGTTSGTERLYSITTTNSIVMGALNSSGQLASAIVNPSADNSQNAYVFDGLITMAETSGSGSYYLNLATGTPGTGTVLSANGSVGVTQIDAALLSFWNNYELGPTHMFVNAQEAKNISAKILQSGSSGAYRLNAQAADANGSIVGNAFVSQYLNQFGKDGNQVINIVIHPKVPPGTIIFYCNNIPYPLGNVANPLSMKLRQDYYAVNWPATSRKYEYGVYFDGCLQNLFNPAFGVLSNIANG